MNTSKVRDSRLPPAGTELIKRNRHGVEVGRCTVTEDGAEFDGELFPSLSAAGLCAAHKLGSRKVACNGFVFWGLATDASTPKGEKVQRLPKEPKVAALKDPFVRLKGAWAKYLAQLQQAPHASGEQTDALRALVKEQLAQLAAWAAETAC